VTCGKLFPPLFFWWLLDTHVWLWHEAWMTHSYVWHDSFIRVIWLIYTCDMTFSYVWHDSFICVTWLIHICDMIHSYVWYGSSTRVTWTIHKSSCMCNILNFVCVHESQKKRRKKAPHMTMSHTGTRRMSHTCMSRVIISCYLVIHVLKKIIYEYTISHIWMRKMTHEHE